jgi:hypothetical protein
MMAGGQRLSSNIRVDAALPSVSSALTEPYNRAQPTTTQNSSWLLALVNGKYPETHRSTSNKAARPISGKHRGRFLSGAAWAEGGCGIFRPAR